MAVNLSVAHASVIYQAFRPTPGGVLFIADPDESDSRIELPPEYREHASRVGDVIAFAGTDRFVTQFAVRLQIIAPLVSQPTGLDVELTIYQTNGLPGNVLWTGTVTGVAFPLNTPNPVVDVVFEPRLTLPDSVAFGVAFANISNSMQTLLGAGTQSDATIGFSGGGVLIQDTPTQTWEGRYFGSQFLQLQAQVTAVPAPTPVGLMAISGLLAARSRRRSPVRGRVAGLP